MTIETPTSAFCIGSLCLFGITAALLTIASQEDNTRLAIRLVILFMSLEFVLSMITLAIAMVLLMKFCFRIPDAIVDVAIAKIENREKLEEDSDNVVVL